MEFTIPQFIEKEPKIVGPLTIKQFVFIGFAGMVAVVFYFTTPFPIFLIVSAIIVGSGFSLAFLKINGIALPLVIKNLFFFTLKPKIYLWKKSQLQEMIVYKKEGKKIKREEQEEKLTPVQLSKRSQLKNLFTRVETQK
jgi:hypothetical protein